MTENNKERLYCLVSEVLGVPIRDVNEDSSPDSITNWDSLSHLNLVLALETEFGVSLSIEDVTEMLSVRLIRMILTQYGVAGLDS